MLKRIYLILIILISLNNTLNAKENIFIVSTVENEIITNHDILKEKNYLKILNPQISKLNEKQIKKIAKESLINEIIKKNEIKKILDINQENDFVSEQIQNLYIKLNFQNKKEFKDFLLNSSSYTYEEIEEKIKIEIMWNELIYLKYSDQVNIKKENLLKKIDNINNQVRTEYNLSEIVFKKEKGIELSDQVKKIESSIVDNGFNNTANIFSVSESSKFGGKIGWIDENNLSEIIFKNIKNLKPNEITKVIKIGNNYLFLKINEIRQKNIQIDKEKELNKMIQFETNKQLNQFSKIFFDKTKMNYSINEK
tara:strand:+ start:2377 stop:3306 length:930 start_codon:yes stop_codon:yes gene_type:complete